MNAAIEFRNVDILFGARGKRRGGPAMQQALAALDAGATRAEVSERTGVIIGVANATSRWCSSSSRCCRGARYATMSDSDWNCAVKPPINAGVSSMNSSNWSD
jgi:hypothetical protein